MGKKTMTALFCLTVFAIGTAGAALGISCSGSDRLETTELKIGRDLYRIEIARTPDQRREGLMYREKLGDFEGMLFVFPADQHLSFWMKDTLVPLSIAYIARDGTIREILDMRPLSERAVESAYAVRYALELPQGAFTRSGVKAGDRIEIPPRFQ